MNGIESDENNENITGMKIESTETPVLRLRGGTGDYNTIGPRYVNGNEGEDEDLYFQASDDDSSNRDRTEIVVETIEENDDNIEEEEDEEANTMMMMKQKKKRLE